MSNEVIRTGILFAESIMRSNFYYVLSTIVALNTTIYAALSIAKVFPKWYNPSWFRGSKTRAETRSIYPDAKR